MKTVERYIAITAAVHFAFALAVLLSVFSVINLAHELKSVRPGQYEVHQALLFVIATLPSEAYKLFPAAALVGSVAGLGSLASRNELVALLAGGISPRRLAAAVVWGALALVVVTVLAGEIVAAPLAAKARARRSVVISGGAVLSTANGIWTRHGSRFINIRGQLAQGELNDIYAFDFDERHRLRGFTYARAASYAEGRWTLDDVRESSIGDDRVTTERVRHRVWRGFLDPRQLRTLFQPPEELSFASLYASIVSTASRGEDPARYRLAFWRRLSMPILTGMMVLLGMPFVFTVRRAGEVGGRVVAGALAGIGFQMLSAMLARFGLAHGLNAILAAVSPAVLAVAGFLWWLRAGRGVARPG